MAMRAKGKIAGAERLMQSPSPHGRTRLPGVGGGRPIDAATDDSSGGFSDRTSPSPPLDALRATSATPPTEGSEAGTEGERSAKARGVHNLFDDLDSELPMDAGCVQTPRGTGWPGRRLIPRAGTATGGRPLLKTPAQAPGTPRQLPPACVSPAAVAAAIQGPARAPPRRLSMRRALGLPRRSESAALAALGAREAIPEASEEALGDSAEAREDDAGPWSPTHRGSATSSSARLGSEASSGVWDNAINRVSGGIQKGNRHIADLLSWVEPLKFGGERGSMLQRLLFEVDVFSQEASAYRGGRCTRSASLEAAAGTEPPPRDPMRASQAASYLIRLVRLLPQNLPMRGMLEPLVRELLEAAFRDWPELESFDELSEADIEPAEVQRRVPFFALVHGHRAAAEQAIRKAEVLEVEARTLRRQMQPKEQELAEEKRLNLLLRDQVEEAQRLQKVAQMAAEEAEYGFQKWKDQTKYALQDFAEMQMRDQQARADVRNMSKLLHEGERKIKELEGQITKMTNEAHEKEVILVQLEVKLQKLEAETRDLPRMRERLERFEANEASYGRDFASRIAQEVLGTTLAELCGARSARLNAVGRDAPSQRQSQMVLDIVTSKLKALPAEIQELKNTVKRLKWEIKDTRGLIPVWNADAAQDLVDAYDEEAPVHRQVFSMKDRRSFAGLGFDHYVPPYLRAEGLVRHVYVSKAELEDFMSSFHLHLFADEGAASALTSAQLHTELHLFMRKHYEGEALTEFAYAFICGLEAYKDDPDFELFDLMLGGAIHPSVTQDQAEMLAELQTMIRNCQEGQEDSRARGRASTGQTAHQGMVREQVSKRMIRAVLQVVFPEKTAPRQNSLRRALHMTLQLLTDSGKAPAPDCAYISDLFANSTDGGQSVFIEEVRRQHYYEVIDFTAELARRLRAFCNSGTASIEALTEVYSKLDPHCKPSRMERLVSIAFPEAGQRSSVSQVLRRLRQNTLLKPERLWVKATTKDVVDKLMSLGPPEEDGGGGQMIVMDGDEQGGTGKLVQPRRCRAVKVVDNPGVKMQSDAYSTPEGLQKAILAVASNRAEDLEPMD